MIPLMESAPAVTVVVPTWNAGPEFLGVLEAVMGQRVDRSFEVLAIDSGSTDGTADLLRRQGNGVRIIEIPNSEFNHGLTRNLGIREARGEIVVLLTQDALPADDHWLQGLIDCYADPLVAGAYSRQLPRPDANPFMRSRLETWMPATELRRPKSVADRAEFDALSPLDRLSLAAFDNVSSSVRRSVGMELPFHACRFGEDIEWATRVLLAGFTIVYEPASRVVHSHEKSMWYEFKRVYLDHQNLKRLFDIHTIPRRRDLLDCTARETRHLWDVVARDGTLDRRSRIKWWARTLPFAFSQNLAQFLGARSVRQLELGAPLYRRLDRLCGKGV
jgi:rhamnosyltransferase